MHDDLSFNAKKKLDLEMHLRSIKSHLHGMQQDVSMLMSDVKRRYDDLDPKTKRRIYAGIAGLGIAIAAMAAYRKKKRHEGE